MARWWADERICTVVLYDLQTTGLEKDADIIQISALTGEVKENNLFNVYIKPTKPISPHASEYNGFTFENGDLYWKGERKNSIEKKPALKSFIKYLEKNEPVILAAHHGESFDHPRLINLLMDCKLFDKFKSSVYGFCDTKISLQKYGLPKQIYGDMQFNLVALAEKFLGQKYGQRHGVMNCKILRKILNKIEDFDDSELISGHLKPLTDYIYFYPDYGFEEENAKLKDYYGY